MRGHVPDRRASVALGPGESGGRRGGPGAAPVNSPRFAPHRHGSLWYLCDRSYALGRRRHLICEAYGEKQPTLFAPEARSGIAEDVLPHLKPYSFDLVYLDPPYGTTDGEWDRAPDWDWLGAQVGRLLRPTGQVVLHGVGAMAIEAAHAFMAVLQHRFEVVWVKGNPGGPVRSTPWISDFEPLRAHELVHVFKARGTKTSDVTFNLGAMHRRGAPWRSTKRAGPAHHGAYESGREFSSDGWRYPVDVVFAQPTHEGDLYAQKPEDIVAYLIATLTKPGDSILDPYAGTGTTLRVAYRLGRRSLGVEASPKNWAVLTRNLAGMRRP